MLSKKLKSFLRDYFTLTSRERGGALALALVIIVQMGVIIWQHYFWSPANDISKWKIQVENFQKLVEENKSPRFEKKSTDSYQSNILSAQLFNFDPNLATDTVWKQLGASTKQISIIRNFINKGGYFRKKEDLAAIYGITENEYKRLEPFIKIDQKEKVSFKKFQDKAPRKIIPLIEINSADTVQLCELPLIGPGRARMIFKYRELLGGFANEKQLLEVFSLDSTVLAAIHPKISIDKTLIRKFNINNDEIKHPYLPKQIVAVLKAYRKQHGNFANAEQLLQTNVVNAELWFKLAPYAVFE